MRDDKDERLQVLANSHGKSIIQLLLDLQKLKTDRGKQLAVIKNLTCFKIKKNRYSNPRFTLHETEVDAYDDRHCSSYVAASYVWKIPGQEEVVSDQFQVTNRYGNCRHSKVRDQVLHRLRRYMATLEVWNLWIDHFSIPQDQCEDYHNCDHKRCSQKRIHLEAMDLVYRHSNHPVALLELRISRAEDIQLLAEILDGELVYGRAAPRCTDYTRAKKALALVSRITEDIWWRRAWISQERYRAGVGLTLLIGHTVNLESFKKHYECFGFGSRYVYLELCVESVRFSREATRLCLALQATRNLGEAITIGGILSAAGKYSLLIEDNYSMSPQILADIASRDIEDPRDRLAIAANCLQYPIRFNEGDLERGGHSLSLSTLAMFLLNGELLHNGLCYPDTTDLTVYEFLQQWSFDDFCAPGIKYRLTFNKGCRLPDPKLTEIGIQTKGHLWELGEVISTKRLKYYRPPRRWERRGVLGPYRRRRLLQLWQRLKRDYPELAEMLDEFLYRDAQIAIKKMNSIHGEDPEGEEEAQEKFTRRYMRSMAGELVDAIETGTPLRVANIVEAQGTLPASAIFVWNTEEHSDYEKDWWYEEDTETDEASGTEENLYIFTATRPRAHVSEYYDPNDINRHVSLRVTCPYGKDPYGSVIPRLYIDSWILGLFFFYGSGTRPVVFPWPSELDIRPQRNKKKRWNL